MAKVNTVLGPIGPDELGTTSVHEHIMFGQPGWEHDPQELFDRPTVFEKINRDLLDLKDAGGQTLVDCSGITMGRDVEFYQALSRSSGVHIVACTGFWAERGIPGHFNIVRRSATGDVPDPRFTKSIDFFEELFVNEITQGMMLRGMRRSEAKAGVIKVGNSFEQMTPVEETTYRAAARAAKRMGVAVITHGASQARRQVEVLLSEGLDPGRIVISHSDDARSIDLERDKEIARRGAYVAYDHVGCEGWSPAGYHMPDERRIPLVTAMVEAGLAERLVLSCDTNGHALGWRQPPHTYGHLLRRFVPRLRQAGISEETVHTILVENPKRLLPF
ncbi:MAG: phosphotriesterase [Dehalococcoidia bacterium]